MAEFYRFFDSTIDDQRFYSADEYAEYFRMVLTNGIYNGGTNLQVTASGGDMSVDVSDGFAWINGYMYKVANGLNLPIENADNYEDRIDRIVIRWDKREEARYIKAFVLKGVPSASPVVPELTRNEDVYELALAQVRVKAGKSFVDGGSVVDERLNTEACGLVNSLIQADTTEIFNQFQAWFNARTPEFELQWENWYSQQTTEAVNTAGQFDAWVDAKKQDFESEWYEWFSNQISEGTVTHSTFDRHANNNTHIQIGEIPPTNQDIGGVWFQIGLGKLPIGEGGEGELIITNAVVSDDEPSETEDLWLDI